MYTAKLKSDVEDDQKRRRVITVTFAEGEISYDQEFQFSLTTEVAKIKRTVRNYLAEINFVKEEITGDIDDYTEPVVTPPTAAELAKTDWFQRYARMEKVQGMIDLGILTGDENPVTNLRNGLKTDFKPVYLADL